jgi:hypothetical protein
MRRSGARSRKRERVPNHASSFLQTGDERQARPTIARHRPPTIWAMRSVGTGMRRPARRSRAAPRRSDCADHSPGGGRNLVVPAAIEGMLSAHAIAETVE